MDDVFEAENALVELDPLVHLAELDVSDDVVEREQPVPGSGRAVRRKRPVPREERPVVRRAGDERVDDLAVRRDARQLDTAVLVLADERLADRARAMPDRVLERRLGIRHRERDVADAVAMGRGEGRDLVVEASALVSAKRISPCCRT